MIDDSEVIAVLLEACPSFERPYRQHQANYGDDLLYVAAGEFARHLLELHRAKSTAQLASAGRAIERLHQEGSASVREFATIGVLEGVRNGWSNAGAEPNDFAAYLGEESLRWWRGLNNFWSGKAQTVQPAEPQPQGDA